MDETREGAGEAPRPEPSAATGSAAAETAKAPAKPRPKPMPEVNAIGFDELGIAFRQGVADFRRAPLFGLFFAGVYVAGGWLMYWFLAVAGTPWMMLPLGVTFPLIGPFVATGIYDVSRRLDRGERLRWGAVLGVVFEQRRRELGWMAFVVLFVCFVWFYQVRTIMVIFLQNEGFASFGDFLTVAVTTQAGLGFLVVGTLVGGFLALVMFSVTVVSIPLLLERDRDFITAIITSVKAVTTSPAPMLSWGVTVTVLVVLAMLPGFLGLFVALPVLGHATWRLYKMLVKPEPEAEIAGAPV